jgi:hypothetical protein
VPKKKSDIGLPKEMTPDEAYIQGVADEEARHVNDVTFSTFHPINVPIALLRIELAAFQARNHIETISLEALLLMVHKLVQDAKNEKT